MYNIFPSEWVMKLIVLLAAFGVIRLLIYVIQGIIWLTKHVHFN